MEIPYLDNIKQLCQNTLMQTLGIEFTEYTTSRVSAIMPVNSRVHQPLGMLHGGASVVLAESIASMGGLLHIKKGNQVVLGQEINANHLKPVMQGQITGIGTPLHIGHKSQVWEVKIYNEKQQLICISRCTLAVIESESPL